MSRPIEGRAAPFALIPVQDLLALLRQVGHDAGSVPALLERLHLPPALLADPLGRVDPRQAWHLCSALGVELDDEQFGLASRPVPPGTTELLVARAMHGRTLGGAMSALAESASLVQPDLRFDAKCLDELHFAMSLPNPDSEARRILLELTAVPLHCTFCWLSGTTLPVRRLRTFSSRRSETAHFLGAMFGCPVEFDAAGVDIAYPRAVANLPVVATDLARWRTEMLGILLEALEQGRDTGSRSEITRLVEHALRDGIRDQRAIAGSAGMSVATLRRKLWREGTSFRALSDRILAEAARQHIDSGATVEVIADRMGYRDARSFRRAFRRVLGQTPGVYRNRRPGPRRPD